jgi:hypothetical protein
MHTDPHGARGRSARSSCRETGSRPCDRPARRRGPPATLDARLADGANPLADRSLCLRARQLLERPLRHRLAFTIDTIVRDAHAPLTLERARQAARLNAGAICAAEPDLRALAARLRDPGTVDERGMAMTSVLLRDGCGPLYDRSAPLPLTYCVRMALLCLDP